ncbi:N/A [soil metagenome]
MVWMAALACAALLSVPAAAQTPPTPAALAASASSPTPAQLQRVEVTGGRASDIEQRRESTAAKIIIGRDEIDRFGDSTVGDLLKRLPGVTIQGRPGRGGNIRMRGLGSGYTQILLDGQRVPPGFSIDSMAPEQIERIEILRAPTAETGARAIAGTINIITREGYTKHINDLRTTAGLENGRLQPALSWTRNDTVGPFIYNYSLSASAQDRESGSTTLTEDRDLVTDELKLRQIDTGAVREKRRALHASGRLQWRGEPGESATLIPVLIYSSGNSQRSGRLVQTEGDDPVPYNLAHTDGDSSFTLARLNAQWNHRLADIGRLEWKAGLAQSRSATNSLRTETGGSDGPRTLSDDATIRDRNLSLATKFTTLIGGEHSLVAGGEVESNRRNEQRITLQNDLPLLADFGDDVKASASRFAAYAQDEWELTPNWAAHAGLRWEGIQTRGSGGGDTANANPTNRSSVWTPLLHAVWKPDPKGRDQVRFSLTRSYRSPTLQNLIARPSINNRYPLPDPGAADPRNPGNTFTQADRAGNPNLKPELATGLDIAIERYLPGSGLLSANVFYRSLSNYMRSVTSLETVSWSAQQRYVSRPQNVGDATTAGLELEAKFRLSDVFDGAPGVDVRANASVFRSRVKSVPGPNNRLDQQPDGTANLGADYRLPNTPLTLGGNLNWTPGYETRISDVQGAQQGRKLIVDAYALWVFDPSLQLRITASNLAPSDYRTGTSAIETDAGLRETAATSAPTYLNLQIRLEMKL